MVRKIIIIRSTKRLSLGRCEILKLARQQLLNQSVLKGVLSRFYIGYQFKSFVVCYIALLHNVVVVIAVTSWQESPRIEIHLVPFTVEFGCSSCWSQFSWAIRVLFLGFLLWIPPTTVHLGFSSGTLVFSHSSCIPTFLQVL